MKPITLILLLPILLFMYLVHVNRAASARVTFEEQRQVALVLKAIAPRSHSVHITRQVTDERGLTSLQFTQDGEDWGLDYCTKKEIDSLKAIK